MASKLRKRQSVALQLSAFFNRKIGKTGKAVLESTGAERSFEQKLAKGVKV